MKSDYTLLYVEDDRSTQSLMAEVLERYFGTVLLAGDGEEALEIFGKNRVDIILTDIKMPKMNGIVMLEKIRETNSDIPVLVTTADTEYNHLVDLIKLKVNGFILKPIDIFQFEDEILSKIGDLENSKMLISQGKLLEEYKEAVDESSILSKADINGNITYVNKKFCEIAGFTKEELLGKNHNIVRHPDTPKEIFVDLWNTIKNQKKTWQGKVKNRKKNGEHYWVDATIKPILDNDNNIVEFIGIRADITEVENYRIILKDQLDDTSKSLNEQAYYLQEYEDALDNNSSIAKVDTNFVITYVNDSYVKLSGYLAKEMIGKSIVEFIDDSSLKDVAQVMKIVQNGEVYQGTFQGKPKSGEPYYTKTTIKPIKNLKGEIVEYLLLKNNITDVVTAHKEIEETQKEIVYKMGEIGESRSKETGNHVKRVAEYSKLLALLAGLSQDEAETLFTASPMHDIGKVAIPDNVLNKPGKLTFEEFEIMKTHAQIGCDVLEGSNRKVLNAAKIVAHEHHEKWDGTGYPRGLKKEEIHIYGRITAIADVYDALGHDRVYKKAWKLEDVYQLFEDGKGKHFDPNLVELFLDNKEKFEEIRERYLD